MDVLFEKQLKTKKIYEGKVFNILKDDVELPNDYKSVREVVEHNGGVVIVAEHNNKLLMVQQYRYATKEVLIELPAGKLDKKNESVLEAAKRELEEETGFSANNWEDLGYIWTSPGFCTEKLYLFKASNLTYKGQHLDDGEVLNFLEIEKNKVFEMIKEGQINDAKTICALMRAYKI